MWFTLNIFFIIKLTELIWWRQKASVLSRIKSLNTWQKEDEEKQQEQQVLTFFLLETWVHNKVLPKKVILLQKTKNNLLHRIIVGMRSHFGES